MMGEMKNLIRLSDFTRNEIFQIFDLAKNIKQSKYITFLQGKTVVLFFPTSSIRTRVTFEKGIHMLGGQPILFDSSVLDKKEKIEDVVGYLNNWADCIIVRHKNISLLEEMAKYSKTPVINAMTDVNHPCEVLSDLYSLSNLRNDFLNAKYLFVGAKGNIGLAWKEISDLMGLSLEQCCPEGFEIENIKVEPDITKAISGKDIILTDSLAKDMLEVFSEYQVTKELIGMANKNALLNPCPPFFRGEEVSSDVISSEYFAGYEFKRSLLEVQQAIIIYSMMYD
jgi:Ornithine carbamoyltransferase